MWRVRALEMGPSWCHREFIETRPRASTRQDKTRISQKTHSTPNSSIPTNRPNRFSYQWLHCQCPLNTKSKYHKSPQGLDLLILGVGTVAMLSGLHNNRRGEYYGLPSNGPLQHTPNMFVQKHQDMSCGHVRTLSQDYDDEHEEKNRSYGCWREVFRLRDDTFVAHFKLVTTVILGAVL
ncbi:hypothetical protein CBL_14540 [Carabus blaptoides fortunei]